MSFPVDATTLFCCDASEELASANLLEKRGRWALQQSGAPAVVDGPRGTFARRLNGTSQYFYANVTSSALANGYRDIIQATWTFETCVRSRSHATSPSTRRTLFMAGYNGIALAWLTFRPSGNFELLWNSTTDSVLSGIAFANTTLIENAWTYVALRKSVTAGDTPSNRLNTYELWVRQLSDNFGSEAPDSTFTNIPQSGLQGVFSWNIGANAGGPSANSPLYYGLHDQGPLRLSQYRRLGPELKDSFGRLLTVSTINVATTSDFGPSAIVGEGGYG